MKMNKLRHAIGKPATVKECPCFNCYTLSVWGIALQTIDNPKHRAAVDALDELVEKAKSLAPHRKVD